IALSNSSAALCRFSRICAAPLVPKAAVVQPSSDPATRTQARFPDVVLAIPRLNFLQLQPSTPPLEKAAASPSPFPAPQLQHPDWGIIHPALQICVVPRLAVAREC